MSEPRKLKKSESLEIRIPYPTKAAFMARCRRDGLSASEALRAFIERELAGPARPSRWTRGHIVAGALVTALVAAIAAPSLAHQFRGATSTEEPRLRAEFVRLDTDRDGRLSVAEYLRRPAD